MDALLLGFVPSAWLVFASDILRAPPDQAERRRWNLLLLSGAALIILVALAIRLNGPSVDLVRLLIVLGVALAPVLSGVLAVWLLSRFATRRVQSRRDKVITIAVITIALVVTAISGSAVPIPLYIFSCAVVTAVVWGLWERVGKWYPVLYVAELAFLVMGIAVIEYRMSSVTGPSGLDVLVPVALFFFVPTTAVVMTARLLQEVLSARSWREWSRLGMVLLCIPLVALVGYQHLLTTVWDVATDGLGGPLLFLLSGLTAIAAALVHAWSLTGRRRWIALASAVIVPFVLVQAQEMGNYGPYGEWGKMPAHLTEQRAEMIDGAIRQYYARNSHYPRGLGDLVPWNLVYVPPPLIIPGNTWCYEGGDNYYSLAYVYREYFSSPRSVKVHASTGNLPNMPACP